MYRPVVAAAALALSVPAHAQVAPHVPQPRAQAAPLAAAIVGRYDYRDREMTGAVELRADGSFDYRFKGIGAPVEGEEPLDIHLVGVWRRGLYGQITLMEALPATDFVQTASRVDPGVTAAIAIAIAGETTEWPDDLLLLIDDGAGGGVDFDGLNWSLPPGKPRPKTLQILRVLDGRSLARVTLTQGGPNRFGFTYTPGRAPAFTLALRQVTGERDMIEVELGQAGVKMRRVRG
jgi:hypothetical protein